MKGVLQLIPLKEESYTNSEDSRFVLEEEVKVSWRLKDLILQGNVLRIHKFVEIVSPHLLSYLV
jgi:hypothetical protein